jgi:hypothetical protein
MAATIRVADRSQYGVWLFYANGEAIRPIKGTYPHVVSRSRAYSVIGSYPRIISPGQSLSELVDGRPARAVAPDVWNMTRLLRVWPIKMCSVLPTDNFAWRSSTTSSTACFDAPLSERSRCESNHFIMRQALARVLRGR